MKIEIKKENIGKFNVTKKTTGKTTEELTHSSNPITKKRAVFAQNAAKWNHKDGSKDVVLDNLIKGHSKSYKMIEKNESPKTEKQELQKFKELKSREIETEGREPIFSPKKKDGTRDLLYYNPSAPTHEQGGVKAKVIPKNIYKQKSGNSELVIPEGSAIITANKGKNKVALNAYKKGDYKQLNKVIDKMPNDSKSYKYKKETGDSNVVNNPADKWKNNTTSGVGVGLNTTLNSSSNLGTANKSNNGIGDKFSSISGSIGNLAPSIFNLSQGLLNKPTQVNRRYINNENYKYQDTSAPARRAANEQQLVSSNNIRNATGGSGGAFLANQAMASAERFKNISDINNQQMGQRQDISNANVGLRNQQNQENLQLGNEYDQQNRANQAKKSEYLGKGLEGISQASQMNQLNKNRSKMDNIRLNTLKTNNYESDDKGNITTRSKKGLKNIKYKMKQ